MAASANPNQYLLIVAMVFASCTILLVHVFVFPLYDTKLQAGRRGGARTVGDIELSLCTTNSRRPQHGARTKRHKCPPEGIVTVAQGGRLGNQIWEYASVWGVSRVTGLVPYVPRCIRAVLDAVFIRLSIAPLYKVAHCTVQWNSGSLDSWNGTSILLPRFVVMPDLVLTWTQDIRREFKFKPKLYENAQNILHNFGETLLLRNNNNNNNNTRQIENNITYIGVHVRRTDYKGYLWRTRKMYLADAAYFHRAMNYYREKFKQVAFIIVSDESTWCIEHLSAPDVIVITSRSTSPGLDLALMASCNHSIIDYGTFGVWGAILAGGETVLYNISRHSSVRVAQLLPNWHIMS